MPNWKLSPTVTEGMLKVCQNLTQRRINVAQTGFPLTREDLELCAVGPELLAKFEDIASYGVATFDKTSLLGFWLDATTLPVERKAFVKANFDPECYYLNRDQGSHYSKKWTLPADRVPVDKQVLLAKWTNNLVRETRMREITQKTVNWFLQGREYSNSSGHWLGVDFITACHVMANWPALAMLVDGKPNEHSYNHHVAHDWKIKFQSVPSNLDRWRTSHSEFVKKQSAIKLATMFLTSCEMLPAEAPKEPVTATLEQWVRLPGDPD